MSYNAMSEPTEYKAYNEGYEQGRADEKTKLMNTLKMLINGDYNSKECKLLYSDFCEFLEE